MGERTENIRFYLNSKRFGKVMIEDIGTPENIPGDQYTLQDEGYFDVKKTERITLYELGYNYLMALRITEGPTARVQFITEAKDDMTMDENWKIISDPFVNMYTLSFNEQDDNFSVTCDLVSGGDRKRLVASFKDSFDTVGLNVPELPYVSLKLDPRKIIKRSKFISSTAVVNAKDDQGLTARAVPLELDFTSEKATVGEVSNSFANSVDSTYAALASSGNTFITIAPRTLDYVLSGTVEIELTRAASVGNSFIRMDLVRYSGGDDRTFNEVILAMDTGSGTVIGQKLTYTFENYPIRVEEGDSIGIMTLSRSDQGGTSFLFIEYKTTDATDFTITTETPYPVTTTKAVKPFDMARHLGRIAMGDDGFAFASTVFGPGGRHENKLLVHGTWLRNMPPTLNEGLDDERRLQANLSLEDMYGAYSLLEPLRFDVVRYRGKPTFTIGALDDIRQRFTGTRIGETRQTFNLTEVDKKSRDVLGGNYYRRIKIGSETSGSNYGAVNNLYSTSGFAEWTTPNSDNDSEYEVLTEFRTGAEDIEVQRQFQYEDNPDIDGEYDDDWFLVDAEISGSGYVVKPWQRYYDTIPLNVFSPETNYNWCFTPVEMLRGHSGRVSVGLQEVLSKSLTNPTGNCNLTLVTQRADEVAIAANEPFPIALLGSPRIEATMVLFETPRNQEIVDQLRGFTKGVDNKFGLMEIKYNGVSLKGYLFEASLDEVCRFKIIQAKL